ncbi:class I SAM-dependent methyltransferase [Thermodesulfobacteriota bacterium]
MRHSARRLFYLPRDVLDTLLGRRDAYTPPKGMYLIGGDFSEVGQEFLNHFITLGGLQPHHRVLDLGCGVGRLAVPLTHYLNARGSYHGLDIVPKGIAWCKKKISRCHSNFSFDLADIRNDEYNPRGACDAGNFVFPYENDFYDFVFSVSVFSHMLPEGFENYMAEVGRVLKPGGITMHSQYLVNADAVRCMQLPASAINFKHDCGHYRIVDTYVPENKVAYDEAYVREIYSRNGLDIVSPLHYGAWCGRDDALNHQDIIVAFKR